jgi:hypothetical protein
MRSVVIHLTGTTREAVRVRLSEFAEAAGGDEWRYPRHSRKPVLYIEFYDDYEREFEPSELQPLQSALGQMPDVIVIANVSGRVPADAEVRLFAESLLGAFRGIAHDGYSDHFWTLAEIRSAAVVRGHPFFDYEGWYRDTPAA